MRLLVIAICSLVLSQANAQNILNALGKGLNTQEVDLVMKKLDHERKVESFLPYNKTYKLDFLNDGVVLEFDGQLGLYKITLFDSGYAYQSFKQELPNGIQWGYTLNQVEKVTGFLDEIKDNPYKRRSSNENFMVEYYFTAGRLSSMKITATNKYMQEQVPDLIKTWGFRLLPDGKAVAGDVLAGTGTMTWGENNAVIYQGEWSYGLPHGKGEYVDTFGNKYKGEFKLGFFWGQGDYYSESQNASYTGQYVMGKKHGKGKISYSAKIGYVGDWFQDEMLGSGVYLMGTDYYYQGQMSNNSINGRGTLHTPDGQVTGTFKNGKPHGYCEQSSTDGYIKLAGKWVNGKKEGKFILMSGEQETIKYYANDVEVLENTD